MTSSKVGCLSISIAIFVNACAELTSAPNFGADTSASPDAATPCVQHLDCRGGEVCTNGTCQPAYIAADGLDLPDTLDLGPSTGDDAQLSDAERGDGEAGDADAEQDADFDASEPSDDGEQSDTEAPSDTGDTTEFGDSTDVGDVESAVDSDTSEAPDLVDDSEVCTDCSACGVECGAVPNGVAACVDEVCTVRTCEAGWADCDDDAANGCERSTDGLDCADCRGCVEYTESLVILAPADVGLSATDMPNCSALVIREWAADRVFAAGDSPVILVQTQISAVCVVRSIEDTGADLVASGTLGTWADAVRNGSIYGAGQLATGEAGKSLDFSVPLPTLSFEAMGGAVGIEIDGGELRFHGNPSYEITEQFFGGVPTGLRLGLSGQLSGDMDIRTYVQLSMDFSDDFAGIPIASPLYIPFSVPPFGGIIEIVPEFIPIVEVNGRLTAEMSAEWSLPFSAGVCFRAGFPPYPCASTTSGTWDGEAQVLDARGTFSGGARIQLLARYWLGDGNGPYIAIRNDFTMNISVDERFALDIYKRNLCASVAIGGELRLAGLLDVSAEGSLVLYCPPAEHLPPSCLPACFSGVSSCVNSSTELACGEAGDGDSCLDPVTRSCGPFEMCLGTQCTAIEGCGNGTCGASEHCLNCASDCACRSGLTCSTAGTCTLPAYCGDGACNAAENCSNCADDCRCGNGLVCDGASTCVPAVTCGNGVCGAGEDCSSCPSDCGCSSPQICSSAVCVTPSSSVCSSLAGASTISIGGTRTGSLTDSDILATFDDRGARYVDRFRISVSAGSAVQLDLTSADFDTMLYLFRTDAGCEQTASDDDGGAGTNSSLQTSVGPGTYHVVVTSYGEEAVGSYSLTLSSAATADCGAADEPCCAGESCDAGNACWMGTCSSVPSGNHIRRFRTVCSGAHWSTIDDTCAPGVNPLSGCSGCPRSTNPGCTDSTCWLVETMNFWLYESAPEYGEPVPIYHCFIAGGNRYQTSPCNTSEVGDPHLLGFAMAEPTLDFTTPVYRCQRPVDASVTEHLLTTNLSECTLGSVDGGPMGYGVP